MSKEREEQFQKCINFFNTLAGLMGGDSVIHIGHTLDSFILCKKGEEDRVTYTGKPEMSLRCARRWNWYANIKKCPDPKYVQCYTRDLLRPRKRKGEGLPSDPIYANSVCLFVNNEYHVIYGEWYDDKQFHWLEANPVYVYHAIVNGTVEDILLKKTM